MKKLIIGCMIIVLCVFGGAMIYTPSPDDSYPTDYTMKEYSEHIQKNRNLIVDTLEAINKPTLKETLQVYERESKSIDFYPLAIDTIEDAETQFIEDDRLFILQKWRTKQFMEKHYSNSLEYQRQFEEAVYQAAEEGEYPKDYSAESYTYKDGSVIQFNGGGMSVEYVE